VNNPPAKTGGLLLSALMANPGARLEKPGAQIETVCRRAEESDQADAAEYPDRPKKTPIGSLRFQIRARNYVCNCIHGNLLK
jgi:hypothetical protein